MRRTCPIEIKRGGDFELNCALLNSGAAASTNAAANGIGAIRFIADILPGCGSS